MRIGIMTFHAASNHGAALQAYALQTQLQKMGHEPFFINYQYGGQPQKGLLGWIGRSPANTFEKINNQLRYRPFIPFQEEYLNVGSDQYFDHDQLNINPPQADVYLCGSDQVWNPNFLNKEKDEHAFWLDFGSNKMRRVGYAPSFGVAELGDDVRARYAAYARRFDAIGVREKNGLELLKKMGRQDAVWVPDPTLLLMPGEYLQIMARNQQQSKPYVFSYQLRIRSSVPSPASQINIMACSALGIDLYESYSLSFLYNIFNRRYLSPVKWLFKLMMSEYVITNSFHATVFSILFHRPFIAILRKGASSGMNSRIESLLELVGLQRRAVLDFDRGRIEELCLEEIDWDGVDLKIQKFRIVGQQFLANSLK